VNEQVRPFQKEIIMEDSTKAKLSAAGKMAFGLARIGSGLTTAAGHGVVGSVLKNNGHMLTAYRIAQTSIEGGKKVFDEGMADWEKTSE
jgi:hypothetical protein